MEYLAWRHNPGVDDAVEDIQAIPTGFYESIMAQKGQMLGNIGFRELCDPDEHLDGGLAGFENIEDFQAFRIGQDLIDIGILEIGFFGEG